MMKQIVTLTIITVAFGLAGCRSSAPAAPVDPALAVQTFVVNPSVSQGTVSVAGTVKAELDADLMARIVAPVASITKRGGDHFRKGELLIRLHAPALGAGAAQANDALASAEAQAQATAAQAALAAANLSRYAQLRERHSVTSYELDQMKAQSAAAAAQQKSALAQVAAARSALAIQRADAADSNLYAPFDGVVTRRLADPGAMAAPGVPLLHVESSGTRDVEFSVPESLLDSLHVGGAVAINLGGQTLNARVASISPSGDAGSHSFLVKATLPSTAAWSSGTVVHVALPSHVAVPRIFVPASAVVQQGGLDAVLAVDSEGRASVRYVALGGTNGEMTEIVTGVHGGDRLIVNASVNFAGKRIEVRP